MVSENYWREVGLTDAEYELIKEIMGREPNRVELGMFGVMWSEHCSYKNSKHLLQQLPTEGPRILQGPGENAGVVDINDGQAIVFKIESHNHPSAVEPYHGAATGVGGIVRDIFTMGARPIAFLNSLRFGSLQNKKTRHLFKEVVAGIADYGNSMGIPTVGGEVYFHPSYEENCLVNAMCVGLLEEGSLVKGLAAGEGNVVFLVGARTGREGIHGAAFASEELSEASESKVTAVQVGDPFLAKILMEACLEALKTGYVVGMQDLGAAGIISSSAEMASRAGTGMEVNVDLIPCREPGMTPYEILLAETQERMLLVVEKGKEAEVEAVFRKWDVGIAKIGQVTADGLMTFKKGDEVVAQVTAAALTEQCPLYEPEARQPEYLVSAQEYDLDTLPEMEDYGKALLTLLGTPSLASKEWVFEQFDYLAGDNTVLTPGNGAAVLKIKDYNKGIALTVDGNSRYVYLDPYRGGQLAVAEAARNLVCVGAQPLALTDGLNFGNPEKPEIFWQFQETIKGISEACRVLETPVVGGNVSLYNETGGEAVYPTPIIGMVGLIEDLDLVITPDFKKPDDLIILLGENKDELGASTYLSIIHGLEAGKTPEINLEIEKKIQDAVRELIKLKLIVSAHDCSEGGLAVALAECCLFGNMGAEVVLTENLRPSALLFGETASRIIISIRKSKIDTVLQQLKKSQVPYKVLGSVGGEALSIAGSGWKVKGSLTAMVEKYRGAVACFMKK